MPCLQHPGRDSILRSTRWRHAFPQPAGLARRNHRSMQEQVRALIERGVGLGHGDALERACQWRAHFAQRTFPHLQADLQADRRR